MPTSQPPPEPLPHVGPILEDRARRQRFDPRELAIVLSHYDVGVIEQIRRIREAHPNRRRCGSRPATGSTCSSAARRAGTIPYRVAFTHGIQLHLADCGYPVPRLMGTRETNNSMLQVGRPDLRAVRVQARLAL